MFKAFIFDFDGLILGTETPEFQSWDLVYKDVGLQLSLDEWERCVGTHSQFDPYQPIHDLLGETFNKDEVRQKRRRHYNELMDQEKPLPGVIDLINCCSQKGIRVSVASSSSRDWVDGYLDKHGLKSHFLFRLCKDDVQNVIAILSCI